VDLEDPSNDERAIRAILVDREEALARGDAVAASSFYAEQVVQFDIAPPLRLQGAEVHDPQVLQRWLETWEGDRVEARLSDITVVGSGDLGAAWGLLRLRGVSKQGPVVDEWSRSTVIFGRRQGEWKILHEHGSYPLRMDGSGQAATDLKP
jgi:ketosteroid isomerase-like protein